MDQTGLQWYSALSINEQAYHHNTFYLSAQIYKYKSGGHVLFNATRTRTRGMTVESVLCISPILASSPRDIQRCSARGVQVQPSPSPSPSLGQGQDQVPQGIVCSVFACFCCYGVLWGDRWPPTRVRFLGKGRDPGCAGENSANSTQKGPGTSPDMLHDAGLEPTTFLLWGNSATHWATVPPPLIACLVTVGVSVFFCGRLLEVAHLLYSAAGRVKTKRGTSSSNVASCQISVSLPLYVRRIEAEGPKLRRRSEGVLTSWRGPARSWRGSGVHADPPGRAGVLA